MAAAMGEVEKKEAEKGDALDLDEEGPPARAAAADAAAAFGSASLFKWIQFLVFR